MKLKQPLTAYHAIKQLIRVVNTASLDRHSMNTII